MKRNLLKVAILFAFAMLYVGSTFAQDAKVVYYVLNAENMDPKTDDIRERPVINAIEGLGYTVNLFGDIALENASEEKIDLLRNADLIVIGRGIGSWNWTAAGAEIWNSLETPVLSTNPFAIRSNQLNWTFSTETYGGENDVETFVTVNNPEDPTFEGITLDEDNKMALWTKSYAVLQADETFLGNGEILLSQSIEEGAKRRIWLQRWNANEEFYESGPTPKGPRTYMGPGVDGNDAEGVADVRYWNYTPDGKTVFLREVARLANMSSVGIFNPEAKAQVSVLPNPAASNVLVTMNNLKKVEILDMTGKLVAAQNANGQETNVDVSGLSAGVYFVKAIDANNNAAVKKMIKK